MILKGTAIKSATHAGYLGRHLINANDNEVCEIWDIDGHARPDDLKAALVDFYETSQLTKGSSKTGLFMISINPEKGQYMTKERYMEALGKLEKEFNLQGQPRAMVYHYKKDEAKEMRGHLHVVWQTTDLESRTNKAQIWQYRNRCKLLAREMEHDFAHKPVSNEKSKDSYNDREREQAKKSGDDLKPAQRKKAIQKAYAQSKDGQDFVRRLQVLGYTAAKGKVGICVVDKSGQVYNLEKELKGKAQQEDLKSLLASEKLEDANRMSAQRQAKEKAIAKEYPPALDKSLQKAEYLIHGFKRDYFGKLGQDMAQAATSVNDYENALDHSQNKAMRMKEEFNQEDHQKQEHEGRERKRDQFRDNAGLVLIPLLSFWSYAAHLFEAL